VGDVSYFEAVILGVVQGLTEFLPISSTAHLRIVPALFGWSDPGAAFTAVVQLGTMAAVVVFFWRDLLRIATSWVRSLVKAEDRGTLDSRMGWYIIIGTIPVAVLGLVFKDQIETGARDLRIIGWVLILFGIGLWLIDKVSAQRKTIEELTLLDGLLFGIAQSFALIPGVSRSGATITMGRVLTYTREDSARFSFLLSVPAVVLSGLFEARKLGDLGGPQWGPTIVATIVAFVVGYASIAWLLRWLTTHSMFVFGVYRVVVGVLVLGLVYGGVISAT
jgi:undecaprenyl-diphosphatase